MNKSRRLFFFVCLVMGFSLVINLIMPVIALYSGWNSDTKKFWIAFFSGACFVLISPWIVVPLMGWSGVLNPILNRLGFSHINSGFKTAALGGIVGLIIGLSAIVVTLAFIQ